MRQFTLLALLFLYITIFPVFAQEMAFDLRGAKHYNSFNVILDEQNRAAVLLRNLNTTRLFVVDLESGEELVRQPVPFDYTHYTFFSKYVYQGKYFYVAEGKNKVAVTEYDLAEDSIVHQILPLDLEKGEKFISHLATDSAFYTLTYNKKQELLQVYSANPPDFGFQKVQSFPLGKSLGMGMVRSDNNYNSREADMPGDTPSLPFWKLQGDQLYYVQKGLFSSSRSAFRIDQFNLASGENTFYTIKDISLPFGREDVYLSKNYVLVADMTPNKQVIAKLFQFGENHQMKEVNSLSFDKYSEKLTDFQLYAYESLSFRRKYKQTAEEVLQALNDGQFSAYIKELPDEKGLQLAIGTIVLPTAGPYYNPHMFPGPPPVSVGFGPNAEDYNWKQFSEKRINLFGPTGNILLINLDLDGNLLEDQFNKVESMEFKLRTQSKLNENMLKDLSYHEIYSNEKDRAWIFMTTKMTNEFKILEITP